jgi:hypothetical protein
MSGSDSLASARVRRGRQRPDGEIGLGERVEQLSIVRGQLVDNADEVLDVGPQLSQCSGVLRTELLQFDNLLAQADLRVRRLSASPGLTS